MVVSVLVALLNVIPAFPSAKLPFISTQEKIAPSQHQIDFMEAAKSVATRDHVAIVVESQPLSPVVDVNDAFSTTDTKKVAALFDYDARQHSKAVAIWRKQFSNPEDIPYLTPEEAQQNLESAALIMKNFFTGVWVPGNMNDDDEDLAEGLFYSLSPAQWELMNKGELAVSSLSKDQQRAIRKYLMVETTFDLQTTSSILGTGAWLKRLNTNTGDIVRVGTELTKTVPRYRIPTKNKPEYPQFSYLYLGDAPEMIGNFYYGGSIARGNSSLYEAQRTGKTDVFQDKYRPTEKDVADIRRTEILPNTQTLAEVLRRQTSREAQGWQYIVEPGLASKPVQVFGESFAKPEEIVRACAAAYGLRVVPDASEHTITLTYPFARAAKTDDEVAPLMQGIMPESVARWLHMRERKEEAQKTEQYNARYRAWKEWREQNKRGENDPYDDGYHGPIPAPWNPAESEPWKNKNKERWEGVIKGSVETPVIALRRFRASVEPRIDSEKTYALPVTQLTDPERRNLAAYFACSFWADSGLILASDAKPNVVRNLSTAYLQGKVRHLGSDSSTPIRVEFEVGFRKNNRFEVQYAFSAVPVKKPQRLSVPLPPATDEDH